MISGDGGEERLAPVIPLFGGRPVSGAGDAADAAERTEKVVPRRTGADGLWRSTWDGDASAGEPSAHHPARGRGRPDARRAPGLRALRPHEEPTPAATADPDATDPTVAAERASESLVRRLRTRALSVAEATTFLRGRDLASDQIDAIIDEFCTRRYLDDALLAGHLVTSGHERKGQGRVVLGRVLAQRGIPRDVAEAALSELPDDDAERALEFARAKARTMGRLEPETARRRLAGQLARRGYPGDVVSSVVRTVIAEEFGRPSSSGVRFE